MPGEYINVRLLTNQSSHSDLNGIAFTVEYEGNSRDYVWEGSEVTVLIPADMVYTVKFNEVDGYKTPESVTYVAVAENARNIEALYQCELLTVNVSADDGEVSGFEVTISKQETVGVSEKYTRLEYIESTGTQYIDTGFKMNQSTRVVMKVKATSISANAWAFEGRISSSSASKGVFFYYSNNQLWNVDYNASSNRKSISGVAATDMLDIDYNKNVCTINGVSVTHTAATFQSSYNLTLLAANTAGTIAGYLNAKLYSCQIYDNDTLIRDYIPALRSDGVAGLYDAVNDTFYVSGSADNFVAGANINNVVSVQTTAMETYKIPFDVGYSIIAGDIEGYLLPDAQSFIASVQNRVVNVVYQKITHTGTTNPTNGVYIQDTDGYCHTESEWDGTYTPNGIAVITSNCRFVIALEDAHTGYCEWGSYGTLVNGITTTDVGVEAKADYAGESNTTTILNQLGNSPSTSDAPAAYYCRAYIFPNGKKGYLGAAGEWWAVLDNNNAITSALSKCGGTSVNDRFWTSTQCNLYNGWYMNMTSGYLDYISKYSSTINIRAFAAI